MHFLTDSFTWAEKQHHSGYLMLHLRLETFHLVWTLGSCGLNIYASVPQQTQHKCPRNPPWRVDGTQMDFIMFLRLTIMTWRR